MGLNHKTISAVQWSLVSERSSRVTVDSGALLCVLYTVLPAIFVGIAVIQFMLACVVFASLIYFIIRDYVALQQGRRRLHAANGA